MAEQTKITNLNTTVYIVGLFSYCFQI